MDSGIDNSAGLKWLTFVYYLNNESNLLSFLFGHLDPELFTGSVGTLSNFDSEYGELVFRYGIIGAVSIMVFWWILFKRVDKDKRFFFILLFWMVGSTIVASYRTFFVFILLLSVVFSNSNHLDRRMISRKHNCQV